MVARSDKYQQAARRVKFLRRGVDFSLNVWNRFFDDHPGHEPSTFYTNFARANEGIIAAIGAGVLTKDEVIPGSASRRTPTKADAEEFLTALPSHFYRSSALERMLSFQSENDMNQSVTSRLFGRRHQLTFIDT